MAERVGIVAVAQTKYQAYRPDVHFSELALEVVEPLLQQTGLTFADDGSGIDATVTCSSDHWDGRTISSINVEDVVGGHLRPEEKIAEDGAYAAMYALMQVLSGHYDTVLVVAHTKESHTEGRLIENFGFDPVFYRRLGLDFLTADAIQARRYMEKYGVTPEQCAQVVVKNRGNARNNPNAQAPLDLKTEDVLRSPMLADPIRELDVKPVSDGACAMIVARESKARKLTDKPVWIVGAGNCYDAHFMGDRDLAESPALAAAAQRAYEMAGVSEPLKQVDVVELSEYRSYQELMWLEGLGFCGPGQGGRFTVSGASRMGSQLPVNPSGGLLSGVPAYVAGLDRVAEVALQLRGEAGARQVPRAKLGLAHGVGGVCGQMHCVLLLERDR